MHPAQRAHVAQVGLQERCEVERVADAHKACLKLAEDGSQYLHEGGFSYSQLVESIADEGGDYCTVVAFVDLGDDGAEPSHPTDV